MTFEFLSPEEEAVAAEVGFVVRPSVSQSHAADRIYVQFSEIMRPRATHVSPDTAYSLSLFNWSVQLGRHLQNAKEELLETQIRLDTARTEALNASVPAPS